MPEHNNTKPIYRMLAVYSLQVIATMLVIEQCENNNVILFLFWCVSQYATLAYAYYTASEDYTQRQMAQDLKHAISTLKPHYLKNALIIAVDFDGVLIPSGHWPDASNPNIKLMQLLSDLQKNKGAKIILYTCRTGKPLKTAVKFCESHGLVFDTVNKNLPEIIAKFGEDNRKVSADLYIDDQCFHYTLNTEENDHA